MNPSFRALEVIGLGLLVGLGVWLQYRQFNRDRQRAKLPPPRLYVPLWAGAVAVLGWFCAGLYCLADSRKPDFGMFHFSEFVIKSIILAFALNVKALAGPLFLSCTLGSSLYGWLEYSEIAFWPLLDILLDWIFDGTPFVVKYVYLAATSTYATVTSVMEEWAT